MFAIISSAKPLASLRMHIELLISELSWPLKLETDVEKFLT